MIIGALVILFVMSTRTWISTTKLEEDVEAAKEEIERLKQILRKSEV
jgi:hypothetical protein